MNRSNPPPPSSLPAARAFAQSLWQRGRRLAVVLAFAVVLLLGVVAVAAFRTRTELLDLLERAVMLEGALKDSEQIRAFVLDLESGQRGYLLTGERTYLAAFDDRPARIESNLQRLAPIGERYPALAPTLAAVRDRIAIKRGELAGSLAIFERDGADAALAAVRTDAGRRVMRDLDDDIAQLQRALRASLAAEQDRLRATIAERGTLTTIAVFAALAACIVTMSLLLRHFLALRREAQALGDAERSQRENREKSVFLANMSHEIRTPMNAISGFAQLLAERVRDPLDRQYVDSILTSGRALLSTINDILDLSKIEAGKLEVHPQPTSLREMVEGLLTVFAQLAGERGLRLDATVGERVPDAVLVDGARVRQMLFNLVGNAIKYTERGEVHVAIDAEVGRSEGHCALVIRVRDTGVGIGAADLARIFEPFEQGTNARSREGTGLGLSIVRRLATLMGGTVVAQSEPGEGSTFRIDLPDVPITVMMPKTALARGRLGDLPTLKVLIVDDVALNRQLLCGMFGDGKHHVLLAEGGEDALAVAAGRRIDLVLMDLRMPGMDGFEAARRLRELPGARHAVYVAVTASPVRDEAGDVLQVFDGLLRKPVSQAALFGEIARQMRTIEARRFRDGDGVPAVALAPGDDDALAALLADRVPTLRETMAMREIEAFANELAARASDAGALDLATLARQLAFAVQSFDVPRTEQLLDALPLAART